jgi:hypothetical protein
VLASGPFWALPATLLARSRLIAGLAGRLAVVGAVGGPLLAVDPRDGRARPLAVGPLGWVAGLRVQGPVGISDLVGVPVLLDLGGSLAPDPPTPG